MLPFAFSQLDRRQFCRAFGAGLAAALLPRISNGEETRDGVLYPKQIPPRPALH